MYPRWKLLHDSRALLQDAEWHFPPGCCCWQLCAGCSLRGTPQLPSPPQSSLGRAHCQKVLLGWGGGSSLMLLTSSPMYWQEFLGASEVPCSIPDFPARLETLAGLCLWVKHQRKHIRWLPSVQHLSSNAEIYTLQYTQVFYTTAVVALTWGGVGWDPHLQRAEQGDTSRALHVNSHSFWSPSWLISVYFPLQCCFLISRTQIMNSSGQKVHHHPLFISCLSTDVLQRSPVHARACTGLLVSPLNTPSSGSCSMLNPQISDLKLPVYDRRPTTPWRERQAAMLCWSFHLHLQDYGAQAEPGQPSLVTIAPLFLCSKKEQSLGDTGAPVTPFFPLLARVQQLSQVLHPNPQRSVAKPSNLAPRQMDTGVAVLSMTHASGLASLPQNCSITAPFPLGPPPTHTEIQLPGTQTQGSNTHL